MVADTLTIGRVYTYTEKIGTEVAISSSDLQSYIISKIIVTNANGQSEEILPLVESPVGSILNNTIRNSSVFLRFEANGNTKISITTAEAPTTKILPSIEFSNTLSKFVAGIVNADKSKSFEQAGFPEEIKRAVIVYNGELTPDYEYLEESLQKKA